MKKLEVSWMGEESMKTLLAKTSESNGKKVVQALNGYLNFLNSKEGLVEKMTPDLLIADAKKEDGVERAENMIGDYFKWLQGKAVEGYPMKEKPMLPLSAKEQAYSKVTSFYRHNKIRFEDITPTDVKKESKTLGADKRYEIERYDDETDEIIYDKEPIKMFLDALKLRDKTIALCMLSSSQDSGDVLALDLDYIRKQKDRKRFFFDNSRAKTNVEFRTFFTVEASSYIRRYMEIDRKDAADEEALFVSMNGHPKRMTTEVLGKNFANAARTAGFEWEDDEVNPFRGKRMRHIFRTACEQAGISELTRHVFMGHALSTNDNYAEISQAKLEKEYSRLEPYLTIYSSDETTAVMQKQLDELEKEKDVERQSRDALRMKNDILEGKVMSLESEQRVQRDLLGRMETEWKKLEQDFIDFQDGVKAGRDFEKMTEEENEDATQRTPPKK